MAEKKYRPNDCLRHARGLRGWSQQELAERLGVREKRTIRRWERGESLPTPYYRQRLCEMFGLNAEELGVLDPVPMELPLLTIPQEKTVPAEPRDKYRQRLIKRVHHALELL